MLVYRQSKRCQIIIRVAIFDVSLFCSQFHFPITTPSLYKTPEMAKV